MKNKLLALLGFILLLIPWPATAQFTYTTNNGTITITGYTGPGGAVSIPDTITGLPVTIIGQQAFYFYTSLTSVTIPNSVTSIGDYAFSQCWSLTNITIPTALPPSGNKRSITAAA